jgi:hypothetical protein
MGDRTYVDMAKNVNYNMNVWNTITTNKTEEVPMGQWKQRKYKTMDEYLEKDYGKTKLKRGRWRIILPHDSEEHLCWHQCNKEDWDMEVVEFFAWSDIADRPVKHKWRCGECWANAPESVITVLTLLEPESTTTLVREVLEDAERRRKMKEDPDYVDHHLDNVLENESWIWGTTWDIGDIIGD